MTFADELANDLDGVFFNTDEFAKAATFTAKGESPIDVTVLLEDSGGPLQQQFQNVLGFTINAVIRVRISEVATADNEDFFTVGGVRYQVMGKPEILEGENVFPVNRYVDSRYVNSSSYGV